MAREPRQFPDKSRTNRGQKTNSDKSRRGENTRDQSRKSGAGHNAERREARHGENRTEKRGPEGRNPEGRGQSERNWGERSWGERNQETRKQDGRHRDGRGADGYGQNGRGQDKPDAGHASGKASRKTGGKPWETSGAKAGGKSGAKFGGRGKAGMNIYEKRAASPSNLIYGVHAVTEAWLNPRRVITKFWATEKAIEEFQDIIIKARKAGINRPEADVTERSQFEARTKLEDNAVHQGLCIRCEALPEVFLEDALIRAKAAKAACFVILDQVTDPHNVGAILRSACAFGAGAVIMQTRNAPDMTGVLAKAACGAAEHIPAIYVTNLSRAIEECKEHGFTVFGLDERGEDVLGAFEAPTHNVIVLGAEGKGLRALVREHCDRVVRLPTRPPIGSLNVSNAAAVSLYAFAPKGS